ncbi:MAG: Serralysin [Planctomycetaceae bacterium]|nr:Serralysin [Planctomycetaceae bacterium]
MRSARRKRTSNRMLQVERLEERTVLTAPTITSSAFVSIPENQVAATVVTATDADSSDTLTFSLSGGADAALFHIDANTGALNFILPPDFEAPLDSNADENYEVEVTVDDGNQGTDTRDPVSQNITVTVTPLNENTPVFTSPSAFSVPATTTSIGIVTATDQDLPAQALTYSVAGGADASFFTIDAATGALSFLVAPDFQSPLDDGGDNIYNVNVNVSDIGGLTAVQSIAVTVEQPPLIFSSSPAFGVNEGAVTVGTVIATSPDLSATVVSYSITGGEDASLFTIDATTGALSFLSAPDFELPHDVGADNVYNITVTAADGVASPGIQHVVVTVNGINDNSPTFTSANAFSVAENTALIGTVTAVDADLPTQSLGYSITGGVDSALFTIDSSSGVLTFAAAPNFESPLDAGENNVYDVEVSVSDGVSPDVVQNIVVTVTNLPVAFRSLPTFAVNENTATVGTVQASDPDISAPAITYSITAGADAALFSIDPNTGVLSFLAAPDFESPLDADADNVYRLVVTASNGSAIATTQDISISVSDLSLTFTSPNAYSVEENTTAVGIVAATETDTGNQAITYSITGGADAARFAIDPNTGTLSFLSAPDFESPTDADANNTYNVTVTASDGTGTPAVQDVTVTVTPVNDNIPVFTSPAEFNVAENSTVVGTIVATDADLPAQTLTYAITGGVDASFFSIDSSTGALTFLAAPNFESPVDSGADNIYNIEVTVSDGNGSTQTQSISATVTAVNEQAPAFTTAAEFTITENLTAVGTVMATDDDLPAQSLTYAITGGADAALFSIDPDTGELTFLVAPDFETPDDADENNSYNLTVTVSDNAGLTTAQDITVSVTNVVEDASFALDEQDKTYYLKDKKKLISPNATFTADESADNYDGAQLVVAITDNRHAGDKLNFNSDAGKFKVHGDKLYFHGLVIGEIHGGRTAGSPLTITFNSLVNTRTIDLLIKHLSFTFTQRASVDETRTITMKLSNADGTESNVASRNITVLAPSYWLWSSDEQQARHRNNKEPFDT